MFLIVNGSEAWHPACITPRLYNGSKGMLRWTGIRLKDCKKKIIPTILPIPNEKPRFCVDHGYYYYQPHTKLLLPRFMNIKSSTSTCQIHLKEEGAVLDSFTGFAYIEHSDLSTSINRNRTRATHRNHTSRASEVDDEEERVQISEGYGQPSSNSLGPSRAPDCHRLPAHCQNKFFLQLTSQRK